MEKKLKRAIIKEELVELTGCYKKAIILDCFIQWSEQMNQFDEMIDKYTTENICSNGWIVKTAKEISDRAMITGEKSIRELMKTLIEKEWIIRKINEECLIDKTLQYKVNIKKIRSDLKKLGFNLDSYNLEVS